MSVTPVTFHSEGFRLVGDLYAPEGLKPGERRAGIVLCHGYTGVKDLYLPDNARVLVEAGYVVLAFDYKGWGESEGPRTRLAPYSRVADVQAALTFLGAQEAVDEAGSASADGHYEVYAEPAFGEVMRESVAWFREHLPPA